MAVAHWIEVFLERLSPFLDQNGELCACNGKMKCSYFSHKCIILLNYNLKTLYLTYKMKTALGALSNYISYTDIIICFLCHIYQQSLKVKGTFVAKETVCNELAWISGWRCMQNCQSWQWLWWILAKPSFPAHTPWLCWQKLFKTYHVPKA